MDDYLDALNKLMGNDSEINDLMSKYDAIEQAVSNAEKKDEPSKPIFEPEKVEVPDLDEFKEVKEETAHIVAEPVKEIKKPEPVEEVKSESEPVEEVQPEPVLQDEIKKVEAPEKDDDDFREVIPEKKEEDFREVSAEEELQ